MESVIGFVVPDEYKVGTFLVQFRRAKTTDSLEMMNDRRNRDLEKLDIPDAIKNIYKLEVYRAYLKRHDEITANTVPFGNSLYKALDSVDRVQERANENIKAKPRKAKPLPAHVNASGIKSQGNKRAKSFSEAERALARELASL
ncbi:hypothetical protein [Vibrio owensii]|uniref:hypothetical protein n=1 Tax=Vibrio owensii TaxID=696485 RepID=UPI0018F163F0|nr:hypothetical protein [Vibrio owensii]